VALQQRGGDLEVTVLIGCEARREDEPDREPDQDGECNGPGGNGAIVYLPVSMSSNSMTRSSLALAVAAVGVLAIALIASPLTVVVAIAAPLCIARCGRGLPDDERRVLIGLLAAAFVARLGFIAAQLLIGLPLLNDLSVGALAGDEGYYLSRALRVRDLLLGYAVTKYDYFVATDSYGQTSYLTLLSWLQVIFGPTPYSMKALNGLMFVCGSALLFRMARACFGILPAFTGLTVLLFLPSLLFSSVSLLKESAYFLVASLFVVAAWQLIIRIHARAWGHAAMLVVVAALSLWLLDGLRRGGLVLMAGGLIVGLLLWIVGHSRARMVAALAALVIVVAGVAAAPAARERAVTAVESAAKLHAGHVFTVGHVYKLLDEGFYVAPAAPMAWDLRLTDGQALRFLVRAAASFVVTPWPWQMRSTGELAFMPEHVLWYLLILALPFGIAAGWRVNPLATALFVGFAIPTAAVVAVTNGNVGTLLRMRGLVTPYLVWISAVGLCALAERLASAHLVQQPQLSERPAL
jgi:hypothetical protein